MTIASTESLLLNTPSDTDVKPPVSTRTQLLPIEELSWQDFEKLCYRLVRLESSVEFCEQYGVAGSMQQGIDIFARSTNSNKYQVFQCKNESSFGPAKIKKAIESFQSGSWYSKSEVFFLCTRESLRSTTGRTDEFERQALSLREDGIVLIAWDQEELSSKLKDLPELVDDFFGRAWVKAFCGDEVAGRLGDRLDHHEMKRLRLSLRSLYSRIFNIHDKGIPLPDHLPLEKRYVQPDIEETQTRDVTNYAGQNRTWTSDDSSSAEVTEQLQGRNQTLFSSLKRSFVQRTPIQHWVVRGNRSLIFGDPGSGKSTFLRYLAIDILGEEPELQHLANRWGLFIPVWIPFSLWTKVVEEGPTADRSVRGVITSFLKSWDGEGILPLIAKALHDRRLLLLVDGLDENSSAESASIALNHLQAFVEKSNSMVIATSRVHGFEKLGMKLSGWQQARIADFSQAQQVQLANIWFLSSSRHLHPSMQEDMRNADVERQSTMFSAELSRANDLKELSGNPLLLCLLISFHIANIRLPVSRFAAYEALTTYLLSAHPEKRRIAADTPLSRNSLSEENLKKALAYLANYIQENHKEGLIHEERAKEVISEFLTNEELGFGMSRFQANELAVLIISDAENNLGIVVKKSQENVGFFHKTMLEYLVSFHLARMPMDYQLQALRIHASDPAWREIVLGLLQVTSRPADVKEMIETIQSLKIPHPEGLGIEILLAEAAFSNFNGPTSLAKDLAKKSFTAIEQGTWASHREQLLKHVLDGLRSPMLAQLVEDKIRNWFPNRSGWALPRVIAGISSWKPSDDVLETLFGCINAEEYREKKAASSALATIYAGNEIIGERLVQLADYSDDPFSVLAALGGLIEGWIDHARLPDLLKRCSKSPLASFKVRGIQGKIELGIHTGKDLRSLMALSTREIGYFEEKEDIPSLLVKGWPRHPEVKQVCLQAAERHGSDVGMERDIALSVLFSGYPMDEDVAKFIASELSNEPHPFLMLLNPYSAYELIALHFRDHAVVVAAFDLWLVKAKFMPMQAYYASKVGRTQIFKSYLLEELFGHWPHWAARGLLECWGINDPEVRVAFNKVIESGPRDISTIGFLLPLVISDKVECRELLLNTLCHSECQRHDFVLTGLSSMGVCSDDSDVVNLALDLLQKGVISGFAEDAFRSCLIEHYHFFPQVKLLAEKMLEKRDGDYAACARAYGDEQNIRNRILEIITPLPTPLRQVISRYLSERVVDRNFALSMLQLYDHETDRQVKLQSAIGYFQLLKSSWDDCTPALDLLREGIVCGGSDNEERRQAAFCGFSILNQLPLMDSIIPVYGNKDEPIEIPCLYGLGANVPYVKFLLQNWAKLKDYFGPTFYKRVLGRQSDYYLWSNLAPFVDEYPEPRSEALAFFSEFAECRGNSDVLNFLSRTMPKSTLLLDYCLNTLGRRVRYLEETKSDPNLQINHRDQLVAAEVLSDNFGGDSSVLQLILAKDSSLGLDERILCLSEGWADSEEWQQCIVEVFAKRVPLWESNWFRIYASENKKVEFYRYFLRLIKRWSKAPRASFHESLERPLTRFLQSNNDVVEYLSQRLPRIHNPSVRVSVAQAIHKAKGLTPPLRAWAQIEVARQTSGTGVDMGYSIMSGQIMPITHVINEITAQSS